MSDDILKNKSEADNHSGHILSQTTTTLGIWFKSQLRRGCMSSFLLHLYCLALIEAL